MIECILVLVLGLGIGLVANAANPKGLNVSENYFHRAPHTIDVDQPATHDDASSDTEADETTDNIADESSDDADAMADESDVWREIRALGLNPIDHETAVDYYMAPAYNVGRYIFIDARDDDHYQAGHIPGAYQLDHFAAEKYLDDVLPICRNAEKIIVYCNGGECEDSTLVAQRLVFDHGINPELVYVYTGGVQAWKADGLTFEMGDRNSGDVGYLNE